MRFFQYSESIPKILYILSRFTIKKMFLAKLSLLITKVCYAFFWVFDQLECLAKMKLVNMNPKRIESWIYVSLFLSSFSSFLYSITRIKLSYTDESLLRNQIVNKMSPLELLQVLGQISQIRK